MLFPRSINFLQRSLLKPKPVKLIGKRTLFVPFMTEPRTNLTYEDGPLVWVDCEMTGLNPKKDKILEIAVIITDGQLQPVDKGLDHVIKTEKAILDR
jgi:DNA polymerase III epsilon subunit-like protein